MNNPIRLSLLKASVMDDKKVQALVAKLEQYRLQLTTDEEKSKAFLVEVGVLTSKGNLSKNYKHLCIPQEQD
jgi:hypothetical protein